MTKRRLATDIVLHDQPLWYGGKLMSRKQIIHDLEAKGLSKQHADFYLFCLANHQPGVIELPEAVGK